MSTADRIRNRWRGARNSTDITTLQGGNGNGALYSGSSMSATSSDFPGDWRSADSWMRQDLFRARNRSRQMERGNPLCIGYKRNMINNVLGARGFHFKAVAKTGAQYGDATAGQMDTAANAMIHEAMEVQGRAENFTTRKILSRQDADELLLSRLIFDGEIIVRKQRGFANECGFAWQIIDPDYLDFNLNRIESGYDHAGVRVAEPGNITKMGVELDKDFKFPVAYWFLQRRPNDFLYNYTTPFSQRYIRVPAAEIIHIFMQTDDAEQTRGFPWIFAALINLNRSGMFQEAALVNATIGASRGVYFKKTYPTGFDGDPRDLNRDSVIPQQIPEGSALELPYGVEPVAVDMRYPDAELGPFLQAMNLGVGQTFGTSYSTTTGDLSQANFVSSRVGQIEEREFYTRIQERLIRSWKKPGFDEELYRAMLTRRIALPLSKFDKFNAPKFTGRRWQFVQPVDENRAMEMALNNRTTAVSMEIERQGGDPDEVFEAIAADGARMKALGFERLTTVQPPVEQDGEAEAAKKAAAAKKPEPTQKK